jgi:hypothetical protein
MTNPGRDYIQGHNGIGSDNGMYGRRKIIEPIEAKLCECGCLKYAKPGNRFILGHSLKNRVPWNKDLKDCFSDETVKAMSDAKMGLRGEETNRYGTTTTEQGLENMRIAVRKRLDEGEVPAFLGHHHTEETKEVLRQDNLGKTRSRESVEQGKSTLAAKGGPWNKGKQLPPSWNAGTAKPLSPPQPCACGCLKMTQPGCKYIHGHHARDKEWTPEAREATRVRTTEDWANYTDEERNARVLSWAESQHMQPNKPESGLFGIVDNLYPANYKYTGGGDVVIAGKIPDFININGQKKIIELFGDYWHKDQNPQDRINIFKPYGYDTLVVWEHELKDVEKLKCRIIEFHERNYHENNTPEELRHG